MTKQNSTELEWRTEEGEDFWWDDMVWDVWKAKNLLQSVPHPISPFDVTRATSELDSVGIRWDELDAADLTFPLIIGWLDSKPLVIDGWHRIAKCSKLGLSPLLPAVILTREESEAFQASWGV